MRKLIILLFTFALCACSSPTASSAGTTEVEKYILYLEIESDDNLFFSTYDMDIFLDDTLIGSVSNGDTFKKNLEVSKGSHTIEAKKTNESDPSNKEKIVVKENTSFYTLLKHSKNSIDFENTSITAYEAKNIEMISVTGLYYIDAKKKLEECGFENIHNSIDSSSGSHYIVTGQPIKAGDSADSKADIILECIHADDYFSDLLTGKSILEIENIKNDDPLFLSMHYVDKQDTKFINEYIVKLTDEQKESIHCIKAGEYDKYVPKISLDITYDELAAKPEQNEESSPSSSSSSSSSSTASNSSSKTVSYSTNDLETAKQGNTGIFSYKSRGGTYDNYWIINFDEGCAYWFSEGNGSETSDRVKIDSGDLNSVMIVTYHDGGDTWSYGLHFKWKNQPDQLVMQDEDGYEWDYYSTNLDSALSILQKKTISDY